jgi:DNA replication protein DnaC
MLQQTKEQLQQLKLPSFIEVIDEWQQNNSYQDLSFDELLCLMADREINRRLLCKQERLMKQAKLRHGNACMEAVDYQANRKLNKNQFKALIDCQWIKQGKNCIFIGPTGVGKSYLACALGHRACSNTLKVRYYRVPRLIELLRVAHADGSYTRILEQIAKIDLLILDDWGLDKLERVGRRDILEILEDRCGIASTIITTQLPIEQWHEYIGDSTIADAICDRIINQSIVFNIEGDSMRKVKNT